MARRAQIRAQKDEATVVRLENLAVPEGPAWARDARAEALRRVRALGLPHRRDEYWRWTDPTTLSAAASPPAALFDPAESPIFGGASRLRVVFVDGVFAPELSDPLAMEGVEIARLAGSPDLHWARDLYGQLEARYQSPIERPLAALNTALAADGLLIRVTGRAARPIHIQYRHGRSDSDAVLHHVVRVEEGAEATILESGPAASRFNECMEVEVAGRAAFHHVRIQGRDHERRAVTHLFARLGEESLFKSFTLTANGVLTRNEVVMEMVGQGANAHVAGAALGDGARGDFHHDDTVFVIHGAEGCESRQVFKKVLRNGARGIFQGKILVRPGAQRTDGYQISQGLLLDEASQFLAKPELEIYADDVKCSHGSTAGALDETALYYLRSRGLPLSEAQDLLTLAFLAEAIEEIADEALQNEITLRLEEWQARRRRAAAA